MSVAQNLTRRRNCAIFILKRMLTHSRRIAKALNIDVSTHMVSVRMQFLEKEIQACLNEVRKLKFSRKDHG